MTLVSKAVQDAIAPSDNGQRRPVRRSGRPAKITPRIISEVKKMLPITMYIETVGATLGISRGTFYNWAARGRVAMEARERGEIIPDEERIYLRFFDAIAKGLADGETRDLVAIARAGTGTKDRAPQWQACAWRLERRFPDRWGQRSRVEVTGKDGEAIQLEQRQLDIARMVLSDPEAARHMRKVIEQAMMKALPEGEQ